MRRQVKQKNSAYTKRKIQLIVASVLTVCLVVLIPVFAWFNGQQKAAEMFKVKYPNSLFINAAHREDRKFFNLDEIDVTEDVNGVPVLSKLYVFTVSGESTNEYTLLLAHTNNNGFTYKIYEATELPNGTGADVSASLHPKASDQENVGPDENKPENTLVFDDVASGDVHYSKGNEVNGRYFNLVNDSDPTVAKRDASEVFYQNTYGSNTNVHFDSVPSYWQATIDSNIDPNTKKFCNYFILEVSWEVGHLNNKETDLIYLSVERKS